MPYDNDLSSYGPDIIEMIRKGTSDRVAATVWADFPDQGIYQYSIAKQKVQLHIDSSRDNSGNISCYKAYLNWVQENFSFKKCAIIFLNHGGKLDEICLDEQPEKEFLDISQSAKAIEDFADSIGQKAALTFLQVCAKGSLEAHLEYVKGSDYTLYSQGLLGAPNYYYEATLKELSKHPEYSGKDLAWLIAQEDKVNMYDSYTCINNQYIPPLVKELKRYLFVISSDSLKIKDEKLIRYRYLEEEYWDLMAFVEALNCKQKEEELLQSKIKLKTALKNCIAFNKKNSNSSAVQNYCGTFILSPYNNDLKEYQGLKYFQEIQYDSLLNKTKL